MIQIAINNQKNKLITPLSPALFFFPKICLKWDIYVLYYSGCITNFVSPLHNSIPINLLLCQEDKECSKLKAGSDGGGVGWEGNVKRRKNHLDKNKSHHLYCYMVWF